MRVNARQEEDKQVIRNKIVEVFAAGDAAQELASRRFDKEVSSSSEGGLTAPKSCGRCCEWV